MRKKGEWGVGNGEWQPELEVKATAPTPHAPLPTPNTINWPLLYTAVIGELALLILIFYAFTKAFA